VTPTTVWLRWGWLRRRIRVVPVAKAQSVAVAESPFDRRRGMAAFEVDTANAGPLGAAIRVPYLERALADRLWADLADRAARTRFRW
jgi:putative membrane protein